MKTTNITLRIDENLKKQAEELFNDFGLTINSAFNVFLRQSVREQKIPFEISRVSTPKTINDEELMKLAEKELKKHKKVYEELAK